MRNYRRFSVLEICEFCQFTPIYLLLKSASHFYRKLFMKSIRLTFFLGQMFNGYNFKYCYLTLSSYLLLLPLTSLPSPSFYLLLPPPSPSALISFSFLSQQFLCATARSTSGASNSKTAKRMDFICPPRCLVNRPCGHGSAYC